MPEVELAPLTLAVWFMDDGCRSRTAVYLNTQQFDPASQETLLRLLREQFRLLREQWRIEARLNRDKQYHRIRLTVDGAKRLASMIEPLMLEELKYKLPQVTP